MKQLMPRVSAVQHLVVLLLCQGLLADYAQAAGVAPAGSAGKEVSFQNELQASVDRGLAFLKTNQTAEGCWSTPDLPAMTAFALMSFKGDPAGKYRQPEPEFISQGYRFLLSKTQPDGGIYTTSYVTYNTALGMMALLAAEKPEYNPVILKARAFLVSLQTDFETPGKIDSPFDGGIGYGSKYKHSDMGNTLMALEALYYSRHLLRDHPGEKDLNYAAAISFLQNCQNLPAVNRQEWVSDDPKDLGGFVYYPGNSMAGGVTNAVTGRVALRSYGSISYGGMLSYMYANLDMKDARVQAVFDWLRGNFTLDENPGMGPQGMFFYFHTMGKALDVAKVDRLELRDHKQVDWRRELAMKLLNAQQRDGSWSNENNRWMEKDPVLVTCYALLTLERIHRGL